MGKCAKVIVCGMKGVGKTSILEQVIYGNVHSSMQFYPTIEDIYVANIESDRGIKEKVRFYDTAGLEQSQISTAHGTTNQQLPRHYLVLADGYVLVYDTDKPESLDVLISLKKDIDKNKDKKEVITVVIGNKTKELDASEYDSTLNKAVNWCSRERIKHFCASAMQRTTLFESFIFLTSKLNPPPSKSTFPQLSMGKKVLSKET
ncbi:PREDICTED: NF-kappa-B inhibitor-interacting Ras-like protein isoform X1 [Nicrophorus vespilloides]|uniref:NF-kappa-B inhibitor-interacting Ras-like protein isoform X1 n=1 Tax=Nicrophorus vespilloides TaxID=110193 RepID=A0ABM1MPT9_NICVS|nr:PREDICTED: NF-kappa-B inhibitor-interacting Ras-like protein isoform X1 [Nicrophorus vespilloides]